MGRKILGLDDMESLKPSVGDTNSCYTEKLNLSPQVPSQSESESRISKDVNGGEPQNCNSESESRNLDIDGAEPHNIIVSEI